MLTLPKFTGTAKEVEVALEAWSQILEKMQDVIKLTEDNHPLITPQFSGTAEEITAALRSWADIVENFRFLDVRVTAYDNRSKIIDHLQRELDALRAELDNKTATMTGGELGQMKQDITGSAEVDQPAPASAQPHSTDDEPAGEFAIQPVNLGPPSPEERAATAARYATPTKPTPKLGSMIANFNASR